MIRHLILPYSSTFRALRSPQQLAILLDVSFEELAEVLNKPEYRSFAIPKRSGGQRAILAPQGKLKLLQRRLNVYLNSVYSEYRSASVHGFVVLSGNKRRNIISNAAVHTGKAYVLNLDLEDFFHSIPVARVRNLFMAAPFGFNKELASCLALLCCYERKLPAGCPTSPALSNMIAYRMDRRLEDLASFTGLRYTRYADDLTLSGDAPFSERFVDSIRDIIISEGFKVNTGKTRIQSCYTRQMVTGLKVNEKVNLDRKYIRNLRAVLYHWDMHGAAQAARVYLKSNNKPAGHDAEQQFRQSVKGRIGFVGTVKGNNDPVFQKLYTKWYWLETGKFE